MKKVAVVILNYNGKHFLEKFLKSTIELSKEADVIVIDNFSTDNSIEYLETHFPETKIIKLSKNFGFAEGYNQGLQEVEHPYLILLNSDVEVTPNWITPLLNLAEKNENIAAIQPKIRDYNRKDTFEYAGAAGGFLDVFGYAFCKGRIFDSLEKDKGQYEEQTDIFWASGACFFVKSSVFKSLNGFDGKFFAHMEEIDLCWRMINSGHSIMYQPDSLVYHIGGGTLAPESPRKTYLNYRNNLAMMFKNLPGKYMLQIIFVRLCLDGVSGVKFLVGGEFKKIWSILKAHFVFYSWIPYLLKHRKADIRGFEKLYKGSIVYDYFVENKKTYTEICSK